MIKPIRLHFTKPREVGILVKNKAIIGRSFFCVIVNVDDGLVYEIGDDPTVSRNHAVVFYRDGKWYVQDLGSLNGTRVGGELIISKDRSASKPIEIRSGCEIEVGAWTAFKVEEVKEVEEVLKYCGDLRKIRDSLEQVITDLNKVRDRVEQRYLLDVLKELLKHGEIIKRIDIEKLTKIESYVITIERTPYMIDQEVLNSLIENLKSLKLSIEEELKSCENT